jgi:hypothetical protein
MPCSKGIYEVRVFHTAAAVSAIFDDPNLVSCAGLVPVPRLAERAGLYEVAERRVRLPEAMADNDAGGTRMDMANEVEKELAGTLLGAAELGESELVVIARAVTGLAGAVLRRWWVEPVDHEIGMPSTAGLLRVRGVVADEGGDRPWSVFVKLLQSDRHMGPPTSIPAPPREWVRTGIAADLSWRYEADVYLSDLDDVLPVGLRLPRRYRIQDLGKDRLAEWLEDVSVVRGGWDLTRFERAARLLGRLAVRLVVSERLPAFVSRVRGEALREKYAVREIFTLPSLLGDAIWAHPRLAGVVDERLQDDLRRLVERVPTMLDVLDRLPQTFMHGDASPQNLLVPADDPTGFVAIDWSMDGLAAVGYDLGQLLVGLAHTGQLDLDLLPEIHDVIVAAYTAGLADEGMRVDEDVVRYGFRAALAVRSAFVALPLDRLAEPPTPESTALVAAGARLTRYLVDLGLGLPEAGP